VTAAMLLGRLEEDRDADSDDVRQGGRRPGRQKLIIGAAIVGTVLMAAVLVPLLSPYGVMDQDLAVRLQPPSWSHWFGTDDLGRDLFTRTIYAGRIDLVLALVGAALPALLGTFLGAVAAYVGGWVDSAIMRLADVIQAFPFHIFLIAIVFALGAGPQAFIVAITLLGWVTYARLIRAQVLSVRDTDYVTAARLAGLGHRRTLGRHVLPNALPQTMLYLAGDTVLVLLTLSAVSFFGLGVQPPDPEWGQMVASGTKYLQNEWWLSVIPGLMIVLTGIGLVLIADGLDDHGRSR
jgi:peptide/nickel transport system permease protein